MHKLDLKMIYKIPPNIITVSGKLNAVLTNLNDGTTLKVSNEMMKLVKTYDGKKVDSIKDTFVNKLLENNLILEVSEEIAKNLLPFSFERIDFSVLDNSIIEISNSNFRTIAIFIQQVLDYNISALEIRLIKEFDYDLIDLNNLLNIIIKSSIQDVTLILNNYFFNKWNFHEEFILLEFLKNNLRINNVIVTSSLIYQENKLEYATVKFIKEDIKNLSCGKIHINNFNPSLPFLHESLHHNSCLNRKISIDAEGNIKNCPSMKESYGNIKDTTLAEAIEKPGFKKYWDINKDKIAVCKDCEFRYICTDCRAYVEDPEDASGPDGTNLSKPLKCGYNPYTGEWAEWSTNPLKQRAIDFYGMREMVNETNNARMTEFQNE